MKTDDMHKWTDKQDGPYLDRNKLSVFYDKVRAMAVEMFGEDSDGDIPLDINVVDRTRYSRLHFLPIPYDDKVKGPSELAELIRRLLINLKVASDEVDRFFRCLEFQDFDFADVIQAAKDTPPTVHAATDEMLSATDEMLSAEHAQMSARVDGVETELNKLRSERAHQIRKDETVRYARAQRNHAHDVLNAIIEEVGDKKGKFALEVARIANTGFRLPKKKKDD